MIKSWKLFLESWGSINNDDVVITRREEALCVRYNIQNWTIDKDGLVDVYGDVYLNGFRLDKLPIKFGKVSGSFVCNNNNLTTLEGCPSFVGGTFWCNRNKLTSLEGGPKEVCGSFYGSNNNLITLEGCPSMVGIHFNCEKNLLTSLEFAPQKVGGIFNCENNKIISLDGLVSANYFDADNNAFKSNILTFLGRSMIDNKISFIEAIILNITKISDKELDLIMGTIDPQKILDLNDFKVFNILRTYSPKKYAEICALRDIDVSADLGELGF